MILADLIRNQTRVKITLSVPGQKKQETHTGRILRVDEVSLVMTLDGINEAAFPLQNIQKIKPLHKNKFGASSFLIGLGVGGLMFLTVMFIVLGLGES